MSSIATSLILYSILNLYIIYTTQPTAIFRKQMTPRNGRDNSPRCYCVTTTSCLFTRLRPATFPFQRSLNNYYSPVKALPSSSIIYDQVSLSLSGKMNSLVKCTHYVCIPYYKLHLSFSI